MPFLDNSNEMVGISVRSILNEETGRPEMVLIYDCEIAIRSGWTHIGVVSRGQTHSPMDIEDSSLEEEFFNRDA